MLPCCSCLQCGHRHASSGASYKEQAAVGIGFQIPKQLPPHHCSPAAQSPEQTLTPLPHLPLALIKLTGDAGFPMMLFKVTSRDVCLTQKALSAARQNSASAAVQRIFLHLINASALEVEKKEKEKPRQTAGRLGTLKSIVTRKPAVEKKQG